MEKQNKKAKETGSNTDHILKIDEDQTQLLLDEHTDKTEIVEDEVPSPLHSNDSDEKTESLSNFDENTPPHFYDELDDATEILIKDTAHQEESSQETGSSANISQNSEEFSHSDPVNSNQGLSVDEEPTEELLDEVMTKTKKRKKLFIALGVIAGVCILAALAFLIPAQMKASEINKSLDLGEKYLEEGKYEEAILAFNDVIAIEPKQVAAYEGKGSANIGLKNYSEAEAQLETAKTIDYTDNGKLLMSDVYINTNRKDQGMALLDEVTNNNPEETKIIVYASKLYAQLNEYNRVIELLEKKITNTTDKEELKKLYNELINTYVKAGKTEAEILALLDRAAKATDDQSYLDKKASYSVKKPSFSLAPGEYQGTQSLEMIKGNPTDKVYFTIDGSEPNITSTEYTAPVSLPPGSITVKVIEVNENGVKCPVQEGTYTIKQNKLTNEEFVNKLNGIWYCTETNHDWGYIFYFNSSSITQEGYKLNDSKTDNMCNLDGSTYGKYEIIDTTENGGTIYIEKYFAEIYDIGSIKIEFDFGTPGDNKVSYRFKDQIANSKFPSNANTEWAELIVAEYLGNNRYQIPQNHFRTLNSN